MLRRSFLAALAAVPFLGVFRRRTLPPVKCGYAYGNLRGDPQYRCSVRLAVLDDCLDRPQHTGETLMVCGDWLPEGEVILAGTPIAVGYAGGQWQVVAAAVNRIPLG